MNNYDLFNLNHTCILLFFFVIFYLFHLGKKYYYLQNYLRLKRTWKLPKKTIYYILQYNLYEDIWVKLINFYVKLRKM